MSAHAYGLSDEVLGRTWRLMAVQSERQFGAFCFLYAMVMGRAFDLPQPYSEMRNKVVHKGYIPSRQEALCFAATAVRLVDDVTLACRSLGLAHLNAVDELSWKELESELTGDASFVWSAVGSADVGSTTTFSDEPDLDLILKSWIRNFEPQTSTIGS